MDKISISIVERENIERAHKAISDLLIGKIRRDKITYNKKCFDITHMNKVNKNDNRRTQEILLQVRHYMTLAWVLSHEPKWFLLQALQE